MDKNLKVPGQLVVKNEDVEVVGDLIRKLESYLQFKESDASVDNQNTPLHAVVSKYGKKEILKLLESTSNVDATDRDVNFKDSRGFTTLQYVLDKRDLEEAKRLIEAGADVNTMNTTFEYTALHVAAENADTAMVEYLLSKGADVHVQSKNSGCTPLQEAAIANRGDSHFETIQLLLKNGADVSTALISVVDNLNMVKLFIDFKVKPNETILLRAIDLGNVEVVKLLLINGFDAKRLDPYNKSALFRAVSGGNVEMVQLLVDHGYDVKSLDLRGESTLLYKAASCNEGLSHYEVAEMLLKMGLDINARYYGTAGRYLETPFHTLIWRNKSDFKVIELFLSYKPDLTIQDGNGDTALVTAIKDQNMEYIQLLLDRGSDINVVSNKDGRTPLHAAVFLDDDFKMVKYLLNNGADPLPLFYNSPLILVLSSRGGTETIPERSMKFLLKYTDVNVVIGEKRKKMEFDSEHTQCKLMIMKHFAKLQALDVPLNLSIFKRIGNQKELSDHFDKCVKELALAKRTKLRNSWLTFLNLLDDDNRKLKNYAGNQDFLHDFKMTKWLLKMFPIYGAEMLENAEKGVKRRKLFDESSVILSNIWPIFNPMHLVIKGVLDFVSTEELKKFCE